MQFYSDWMYFMKNGGSNERDKGTFIMAFIAAILGIVAFVVGLVMIFVTKAPLAIVATIFGLIVTIASHALTFVAIKNS